MIVWQQCSRETLQIRANFRSNKSSFLVIGKCELIGRRNGFKNIEKTKQIFGDLNHVHYIYTSEFI